MEHLKTIFAQKPVTDYQNTQPRGWAMEQLVCSDK